MFQYLLSSSIFLLSFFLFLSLTLSFPPILLATARTYAQRARHYLLAAVQPTPSPAPYPLVTLQGGEWRKALSWIHAPLSWGLSLGCHSLTSVLNQVPPTVPNLDRSSLLLCWEEHRPLQVPQCTSHPSDFSHCGSGPRSIFSTLTKAPRSRGNIPYSGMEY